MAAITYNDVEGAIIDLLLQGKNPTVDNIRSYLGDGDEKRGSPNTVTKFRNDWREKIEKNRSIVLPSPIPQDALSAIAGIWGVLKAEAARDFIQLKHSLEQSMRESDQARSASENEVLALRDVLADQKRDYELLEVKLAAKEARVDELLIQLEVAAGTIEQLRRDMEEREKQHAKYIDVSKTASEDKVRAAVQRYDDIQRSLREKEDGFLMHIKTLEGKVEFERSRGDAEINRLMILLDVERRSLAEEKRRSEEVLAGWRRMMDESRSVTEAVTSALQGQLSALRDANAVLKDECERNLTEIARLKGQASVTEN